MTAKKTTTRNYGFKNTESSDGSFTCHINKDNNRMLTLYCKFSNQNKTKYINNLIEKDMTDKFNLFGAMKGDN